MIPEQIIQHYPKIYHMAESGSWKSIKRFGLLSTSALLDLFEINGPKRFEIESKQRRKNVIIKHPDYGMAVIRDQKPLPESALKKFIDGMSTTEYYELLNHMTFFWARKERLERLLNARAYKNKTHTVLTVDTAKLLKRHQEEVWLAHINSGAFFGSGRRGVQTFKRIKNYPFEEMKKKKKEDAIVEIAIDYAVKDILELTIRVEEWKESKPIYTIWNRN